eukprot:gb/GFBE01019588.1/.p1 GENE.gb/GFBE01019588.1/~~gb/GFBE01019588.1/.p1  ORF type:complete len:292 (+),score=72.67 gb/GFBE01019588.1/:1-876(+)
MKTFGIFALAVQLVQGLKGRGGVAQKPPVTIVSFDKDYKDLWQCWANHMNDANNEKEVIAVALDDEAIETVSKWKHGGLRLSVNLNTKFAPKKDAMMFSAWPTCFYSMVYFQSIRDALLDGHEAVLKTDLDAIPLRDPWEMMANASDADIITKSEDYPGGYNGGAFNTGFMLYRNTPEVIKLLDDIIAFWASGKVPKDGGCNDQFQMTEFINKRGCSNFGLHHHVAPEKGYWRGKCGNIKVAAFAENQVKTGMWCVDANDCKKKGVWVMHSRHNFLTNTCGKGVQKVSDHA